MYYFCSAVVLQDNTLIRIIVRTRHYYKLHCCVVTFKSELEFHKYFELRLYNFTFKLNKNILKQILFKGLSSGIKTLLNLFTRLTFLLIDWSQRRLVKFSLELSWNHITQNRKQPYHPLLFWTLTHNILYNRYIDIFFQVSESAIRS